MALRRWTPLWYYVYGLETALNIDTHTHRAPHFSPSTHNWARRLDSNQGRASRLRGLFMLERRREPRGGRGDVCVFLAFPYLWEPKVYVVDGSLSIILPNQLFSIIQRTHLQVSLQFKGYIHPKMQMERQIGLVSQKTIVELHNKTVL